MPLPPLRFTVGFYTRQDCVETGAKADGGKLESNSPHSDWVQTSTDDDLGWNCVNYSTWCKTQIHSVGNPMMIHAPCMQTIFEKLGFEGNTSWHDAASQVIRCWTHMHQRPIRLLISSYMALWHGDITEDQARHNLKIAFYHEYRYCFHISDTWDREMIKEFHENENLQNTIHDIAVALKERIALLQWCSEWKNYHYFWCYNKGPGNVLLKTTNHPRAACEIADRMTHMDFANMTINEYLHPHFLPRENGVNIEPSVVKSYKATIAHKYTEKQRQYVKNPDYKDVMYRQEFLDMDAPMDGLSILNTAISSRNARQKQAAKSVMGKSRAPNKSKSDKNHGGRKTKRKTHGSKPSPKGKKGKGGGGAVWDGYAGDQGNPDAGDPEWGYDEDNNWDQQHDAEWKQEEREQMRQAKQEELAVKWEQLQERLDAQREDGNDGGFDEHDQQDYDECLQNGFCQDYEDDYDRRQEELAMRDEQMAEDLQRKFERDGGLTDYEWQEWQFLQHEYPQWFTEDGDFISHDDDDDFFDSDDDDADEEDERRAADDLGVVYVPGKKYSHLYVGP